MFKQTNNNRYEEYKSKYYPIDAIAEACVDYYGEEFRDTITETKEQVEPAFVYTNFSRSNIIEAFKTLYKNNAEALKERYKNMPRAWEQLIKEHPEDFWMYEADNCIWNLECFATKPLLFSPYTLARHKDVLQYLGFDISKILLKNKETGLLKENSKSKETEKLKNYVKNSINGNIKIDNFLNIDDFIKKYNVRAENKINYHIEAFQDPITNTFKDFMQDNPKSDFTFLEDEIPKIPDNLTKKDKQFLSKFIETQSNLNFIDENSAFYILQGINKIFNKNFQNIQELQKDTTLSLFLEYREDYSLAVNRYIFACHADRLGLISSNYKNPFYQDTVEHFTNKSSVAACYEDNLISISMEKEDKINVSDITHEFNHAIGHKYGAHDFSPESRGFDEIVNEFLTINIMKKIKPEQFENDPHVKLRGNYVCTYQSGIDLMSNFLNKYENLLKMCKIKQQTKILKDFIGEENFKRLMKYSTLIEEQKYGRLNYALNFNGKKITTIKEMLELYNNKQISKDNFVDKAWNKFKSFIEYNNFVNQLVEHYEEFEKGNIINFQTETEISEIKAREEELRQKKQKEEDDKKEMEEIFGSLKK